MLDVKNPEIDVDAIMQRIQEKVRLRKVSPAAPGAPSPMPESALIATQKLALAREYAQVGTGVPPMSRTHGLKRVLARIFAKIFLRIAQLVTRDQRAFNLAVVESVQSLLDGAEQQAARVERAARSAVQEFEAKVNAAEQQARRIDELERRLRAADQALTSARQEHTTHLVQMRTAVALQERRLTLLLEEARRRLPAALEADQLQKLADELPHVQDAKYLAFEDAFRGSREDIKQRVAVYLPRLRAAGAGAPRAPILDVGCGRGELLEVLRDAGLQASGVDSNAASVEQCRALGLEVEPGDLFERLSRVPDGSLGALVGLHVVEHLPFQLLLRLLDEALRVLRPGGLAIFETPNPQNILVGACNFYIDPTHRNPVHPQTLHYLVELRGMIGVETLPLHPFPEGMRLPEDAPAGRFINQHFFGPQDYAVVGQRP